MLNLVCSATCPYMHACIAYTILYGRVLLSYNLTFILYANVSRYSCTHSLSMFMICLSSICVQQCVHACNQCLLLSCLCHLVAMHVAVVHACMFACLAIVS